MKEKIRAGCKDPKIEVRPTGNGFSIASSEYEVLVDGEVFTSIWSPPWNYWTKDEEERRALIYARELLQQEWRTWDPRDD